VTKYVYDFSEGNKDMKDLLGGKGANLAEMTNMGLPVPPGFTITTEACLTFLKQGGPPPEMLEEAGKHLVDLQEAMGRNLGDPDDPLLVSVRSGAKFSMPGMMDTVLNLGLNDESVRGLAKQTGGDMRFANDAYRRFIQMFGKIVMDVPADAFEHALDAAKERRGPGTQDTDLDADDLAGVIERFRAIYQEHTGDAFPQDPSDQLRLAIDAVFSSWNGKRAIDYRRQNKISDDLGTAVNVQAMVFGNLGDDSGTGVAFTRDPATGRKVPYGDYLANAQGEDVVAGIRNTLRIADLEQLDPPAYAELRRSMDTLEGHYHDMCDIEFTIEKRKFWLLQTRIGKRTAFAEWVMAYDMLEEGLIGPDEALLRVDANRLEELFKRRVDDEACAAQGIEPIATGLNASPGAASGKVVFSADEAQEWATRGEHGEVARGVLADHLGAGPRLFGQLDREACADEGLLTLPLIGGLDGAVALLRRPAPDQPGQLPQRGLLVGPLPQQGDPPLTALADEQRTHAADRGGLGRDTVQGGVPFPDRRFARDEAE
jgi:pyruvate,orthophosphate dikinase